MRIGVIGTGIMSSYIVTGFCEAKSGNSFILSPRNKQKAELLQAKYPNSVTIAKDNQEVVDNCETVILSVLPQNAQEILSAINFRENIDVISIIPILGLEKIKEIIGDTNILVDVLPLPFISQGIGPIVIYPQREKIVDMLKPLGEIIVACNPQEMSAMRTITALMSPYYEIIHHIVEWGQTKSLSEQTAKAYTTSFFSALSTLAANTQPGKLKELAQEMTPGGLNWQATEMLKENDAFVNWQKALDSVYDRVVKK